MGIFLRAVLAALALVALADAVPHAKGRRLQPSVKSAFRIPTSGASVDAAIDYAGGRSWFAFEGHAGYTYQVETVLGTLTDTVVSIVDTDRSTVLVENDDDGRDETSYASYIEWSCPADGAYYLVVQGYGRATGSFSLSVTEGALLRCAQGFLARR